jgi:hypothetical protein
MGDVYRIDLPGFAEDPYPDLAAIQALAPAVEVPELGAILVTRRDDVFIWEKRIDIFSSHQPQGLMTRLMGENMMRKDGEAHLAERRALFPALSPRTVRERWRAAFEAAAARVLDDLAPRGAADLVADYAVPVSGAALTAITGLTAMTAAEMDRVSQHMIDGCANYAGDPAVEARCHAATRFIDDHIDRARARVEAAPDASVLSVQLQAGLPMETVRANVKLVISGGQNEPRDAIAGTAWALLSHPDQLAMVRHGRADWVAAFEEYARWIAPIGMSPRRVARRETVLGRAFRPEERVFFMFGAANRDPRIFENPDRYDITRDTAKAVTFGAGPHFCAGAAAARTLIAEVALPMLFDRLPRLRLAAPVRFAGWAFRGPLSVAVRWD